MIYEIRIFLEEKNVQVLGKDVKIITYSFRDVGLTPEGIPLSYGPPVVMRAESQEGLMTKFRDCWQATKHPVLKAEDFNANSSL